MAGVTASGSRLAALILALLSVHGHAQQAASQPEGGTVYRCPGPPVAYKDDLSAKQAMKLGCRAVDGSPITLAPPASPKPRNRALSSSQQTQYNDCRMRAAQAPTTLGVQTGLKLCDEQFGLK